MFDNNQCFFFCLSTIFFADLVMERRGELTESVRCLCSCSPSCILYNDCCPDIFAKQGKVPPLDMNFGHIECSPIVFGHNFEDEFSTVRRMIAKQFSSF